MRKFLFIVLMVLAGSVFAQSNEPVDIFVPCTDCPLVTIPEDPVIVDTIGDAISDACDDGTGICSGQVVVGLHNEDPITWGSGYYIGRKYTAQVASGQIFNISPAQHWTVWHKCDYWIVCNNEPDVEVPGQ